MKRILTILGTLSLSSSLVMAAPCHFKASENMSLLAEDAQRIGELSTQDVQYINDYGNGSAENAAGNGYSCINTDDRLVVIQILLTRSDIPASVVDFILENETKIAEGAYGPN